MNSETSNRNIWKQLRIRYTRNVLMIFLAVIMLQAVAYIAVACFFMLKKYETPEKLKNSMEMLARQDGSPAAWICLISAVLILVFGIFMYRKDCGFKTEKTDLKKTVSLRNILMCFLVADGSCMIFTAAVSFAGILFPEKMSGYGKLMSGLTDTASVVMMIYVIFAGPVSEEIIFRGAMLKRLDHVYDFLAADIIQAALFGIYHMNLVQGIYSFLLGIILGAVWKNTGTVLMTIITHILFNTCSFTLSGIESEIQKAGIHMSSGVFLTLVFVLGIVLLVPGLLLLKNTVKHVSSGNCEM